MNRWHIIALDFDSQPEATPIFVSLDNYYDIEWKVVLFQPVFVHCWMKASSIVFHFEQSITN